MTKSSKNGIPPKQAAKTARRGRIAAAVVAGTPLAQVARTEGLSRTWISREANATETRQIIAALVDHELDRLVVLFQRMLTVIEEAFGATRPGITEDGQRYDLGPDHYARLTAAKRFIELVTAGRPVPKAPDPSAQNRQPTWAEILELYNATGPASDSPQPG
jgi:hypothetical protein